MHDDKQIEFLRSPTSTMNSLTLTINWEVFNSTKHADIPYVEARGVIVPSRGRSTHEIISAEGTAPGIGPIPIRKRKVVDSEMGGGHLLILPLPMAHQKTMIHQEANIHVTSVIMRVPL